MKNSNMPMNHCGAPVGIFPRMSEPAVFDAKVLPGSLTNVNAQPGLVLAAGAGVDIPTSRIFSLPFLDDQEAFFAYGFS